MCTMLSRASEVINVDEFRGGWREIHAGTRLLLAQCEEYLEGVLSAEGLESAPSEATEERTERNSVDDPQTRHLDTNRHGAPWVGSDLRRRIMDRIECVGAECLGRVLRAMSMTTSYMQ